MRTTNINMLEDTLRICRSGLYEKDDKRIRLKLTAEEMEEAIVYLPDDIKRLGEDKAFLHINRMGRVDVNCVNQDSFSHARACAEECRSILDEENRILVLNLANAVRPGGGVRTGATAQEEDLCRKSSLLLALESQSASSYYSYNKSLHSHMGSDAIILHPNVEIIKDAKGNLLDDSVVVSVLTCAAPNIRDGLEGMTQEEYQQMIYNRIMGMLIVAAYNNYQVLVLGAFGCGAFRNDAKVVSDLFYRAMKDFRKDTMCLNDCFRRIDFAVMDHSENLYNFREFQRNFENFYRDEDSQALQEAHRRIREKEKNLDKIRGSLIGGAAGDALGYAIEFESEADIVALYGKEGIKEYQLDSKYGKALISDDTQMTLFTANGLLVGSTRLALRGIGANPHRYVTYAYQDWLLTQTSTPEKVNAHKRYTEEGGRSWLLDVPELYSRRAPGNTCLQALTYPKEVEDYLRNPVNNSKGCGGIMRVVPLALLYNAGEDGNVAIFDLDKEGAYIAAITHGHPLGYMPAAVVTHIINRLVYGPKMELKEIVLEAKRTCQEIFAGFDYLDDMCRLIDLAITLSENEKSDLENIHRLGEGWVAEETLAIALYCSLKYQNDFSKALTVAVNHKGDSDSTGAVTGNILGAYIGYNAIDNKWKKNLELHDLILEVAEDLCHDCQMSEYGQYRDPVWETKYVEMHKAK